MYGMMLPSGNDASTELAMWAGGLISEEQDRKNQVKAFVNEMNKYAKQIGLKNSKFCNPHGLPHQ